LACRDCGRRGQYRIDRLLDRYGPDFSLPELRHARRGSPSLAEFGYLDPLDGEPRR